MSIKDSQSYISAQIPIPVMYNSHRQKNKTCYEEYHNGEFEKNVFFFEIVVARKHGPQHA